MLDILGLAGMFVVLRAGGFGDKGGKAGLAGADGTDGLIGAIGQAGSGCSEEFGVNETGLGRLYTIGVKCSHRGVDTPRSPRGERHAQGCDR